MTTIVDLSGVKTGDIICSVKISPNKKWVRILKDNDGNEINLHKLKVERSLNSSHIWILCLYNSIPNEQKHIFHLNLEKIKMRIWSN
jgi:hypothetical protein|uniref:Uncharacterized protein n=1 Tax=viral metagenome TaxID=1070528 RepID=A0A6C0BY24_9ZZZZ